MIGLILTQVDPAHLFEVLRLKTYVAAVVVVAFLLSFAFIASTRINVEGGNSKRDVFVRRAVFMIVGLIASIGFFLFHDQIAKGELNDASFSEAYRTTCTISSILVFLGYFLIGFLTSKLAPKSKFGTAFSVSEE